MGFPKETGRFQGQNNGNLSEYKNNESMYNKTAPL